MKTTQSETPKTPLSRWIAVLILMIAFASLAYGLFFAPSLYSDDWGQNIERIIRGNAQWADFSQLRPLMFVPFLIQYHLFGINVTANYLVLWLLYIAIAILLWRIIALFPALGGDSFACLTALLFLVYPTNYTHMWLVMTNLYSAMLLSLVSAYFLARYASGRSVSYLLLSSVFLALSLGIYDGQLGVMAAWPVLLFLIHYRTEVSWSRRLSVFIPIVLLGGISVVRALTYHEPSDFYASASITVSPKILLPRLMLGYKVSLAWGWTTTVQHYLPWIQGSQSAVLFVATIVSAPVLLASYLVPSRPVPPTAKEDPRELRSAIAPYVASGVAGLALLGAGYLPVIAVFQPSLADIDSRLNLFASLGSAVFLCSALMIAAKFVSYRVSIPSKKRAAQPLTRRGTTAGQLLVIAVVPFLLLGTLTHASVQYRNRMAWEEQTTLWRTILDRVPNFRDDSLVLFVLPGLQDRAGYHNWWRTPLYANWDASAALRMLYDNDRLAGDVVFPDLVRFNEPRLVTAGVVNWQTREVVPYTRTVAFTFDTKTRRLQQLDRLPAAWVEGASEPVNLCRDCILNTPVADTSLRRLVR